MRTADSAEFTMAGAGFGAFTGRGATGMTGFAVGSALPVGMRRKKSGISEGINPPPATVGVNVVAMLGSSEAVGNDSSAKDAAAFGRG